MSLIDIEYITLKKRGIKIETCKKWGYGMGKINGKPFQVANYRCPKGHLKAQKLRSWKTKLRK